jgi:Transposase DDE domain
MERELWPVLYRLVQEVGKDFSQKYVQFHPATIVLVWLWAVLHDRHLRWACDPGNWKTTTLRPHRLPSPSTISRRLYRLPVAFVFRALEQRIRDSQDLGLLAFLDGKPLPVSGVSQDTDARRGRGAGGMAKGYKLHAVWANRPVPEAWEVTPLQEGETVVGQRLVEQLHAAGYLLGDGNYDASKLFDAAAQAGYQLLVPIKHPHAGNGHHYQSPHRLGCIERMQFDFARQVYRLRGRIERSFGNATSFAGGLGPLPAWVRRLRRVRMWVWAKLLINGVRIMKKQGLTSSLQ